MVLFNNFFYIQSFSFTECIVIVGVRKYRGVCLCVCLSVCLSVCLFALERRNYRADFNETFQKWSLVGLYVRVWVSAHYHNWWRHGRHVGRKNEGTVTATVFIRFSWNFEYNICSSLLGLGLHFSDLRHHLLVKMAVEKTVKTGSEVNSKTKYRFLLILTHWTRIYTYWVYFTKTDCYNAMI